MPEPVSIATSVFSGFNAFIKAISLAAHYKEVPKEVKQLHTNIERAERTINIANRLLRSKAHYLDPRLREETRQSIEATENVLLLVRDSIEGCRKDLELQQTVTFKNRAAWLLWKNQGFLSQLQTLVNCLDALDRDILRLDMVHPPLILVGGSLAPPAYDDGDLEEYKHNGGDVQMAPSRGREKPPFPCSLTKRLRSCNNSSSQINLNSLADAQRTPEDFSSTLYNDNSDKSHRSDNRSPPQAVNGRENLNTRNMGEYADQFDMDTLEVDPTGLGLSFLQTGSNTRQVRFLQLNQDNTLSPVQRLQDVYISELPVAHDTTQSIEAPYPMPYSYSSNNPWRNIQANRSPPTPVDPPDGHRGPVSAFPPPPESDCTRSGTINTPTISDDGEGIAKNFLDHWSTAPAAPLDGNCLTGGLLPLEPQEKKVKWQRKSDFI
ncbi:uncharacterized protein Z519_05507 [Cladophialophora bantiana CBS 173.52]|uniref:Uncharacterized protein n=1 Tax=Cladophialophora bantiana (strain ATCC 10958 / CBS 173.52 / CDC B-1940 / NIH 8579) TaxID=1442370 RepID=A0A0D2EWG3_CLAB1|nr:uncharacterized protein Z519_05507 [Cladophialophora bantiana CBS 173.52]KIW94191.1 hypothetical protein Z519_05507 [Cladophialophora bantiana CBS 173.52]